ncbi:MAG: hypothetical protein IKD11_02055, partial [Oscillospiraceae bacterium]|nr:hypothetical protein [Oscillospiraceae bacterium]
VLGPDEFAAKIGSTNYATLSEAIEAANAAAAGAEVTVTLINDAALSEAMAIGGANKITLDGAAHTLTVESTGKLTLGGAVEVKNVTLVGGERAITAFEVTAGNVLTMTDLSASGFTGDYNGGVVFVNTGAKLVVKNGSFADNAGRNGGVIYLADGESNGAVMLEADGCSFTNNTASSYGGAIFGIINTKTSAAVVKNSTFTGNRSDNLTRGGGITAGSLTFENVSFAEPHLTGITGGDIRTTAGSTVTVTGENSLGVLVTTKTIHLGSADGTKLTLADNKAELTVTLTPYDTIAYDYAVTRNGAPVALTDGAFTIAANSGASVIEVAATEKVIESNAVASVGSTEYDTLAEAFAAAQTALEGGDVTVTVKKDAMLTESVTLGGANKLTIEGEDKLVTLGAAAGFTVNGTVEFKGITLDGQSANRSTFAIILSAGKSLTLTDSSVINMVYTGGYGVVNGGTGSTLTITGGEISGNKSKGGALYLKGTNSLTNVDVYDNESTANGGGVFIVKGGKLSVKGGSFAGNHAATNGGAIYLGDGSSNGDLMLTVDGTSFTNNSAAGMSGAIFALVSAKTSAVEIANATFSGNTSSNTTRGVGIGTGHLTLKNVTFAEPFATGITGGDIRTTAAATLTLEGDNTLGVLATTTKVSIAANSTTTIADNKAALTVTLAGYNAAAYDYTVTRNGSPVTLSASGSFTIAAGSGESAISVTATEAAALSAEAETTVTESVHTTVQVIESTVTEAAPTTEELPAVEEVTAVEELPVIEALPAVEETLVVEALPESEEAPAAQEASAEAEESQITDSAPAQISAAV